MPTAEEPTAAHRFGYRGGHPAALRRRFCLIAGVLALPLLLMAAADVATAGMDALSPDSSADDFYSPTSSTELFKLLEGSPLKGGNVHLDYVCTVAAINSAKSDATTAASNVVPADVTLGEGALTTGNSEVYFGLGSPFGALVFNIATQGVSGSLTWSYSTTSGWTTFTPSTDFTTSFRTSGTKGILFSVPTDWVSKTVDGCSGSGLYYIRVQTSTTKFTTIPIASQVSAAKFNLKIRVQDELGNALTGLASSNLRVSDGDVLTKFAFRELSGGDYETALDASQTDRDFNVAIWKDGYVQSPPKATGTLSTSVTDMTSDPYQLKFGVRVVPDEETPGRTVITGATVTSGTSYAVTCVEPGTPNGNYYCAVPASHTGTSVKVAKDTFVTGTFSSAYSDRLSHTDAQRFAPNNVQRMMSNLPGARADASVVWDGSSAYVFGGSGTNGPKSEILKYTPGSDSTRSTSTCETAGPDDGGYICASTTYSWQDTSGGTSVSLTDDSVSASVTLPFTFSFYGQSKTAAYIGSNGLLCFSSTSCTTYYPPRIPATSAPNDLIACFWEDLNPGVGGTITYKTVGSTPNRIFVVEYNAVPHFGYGGSNTFQIHLTEGGEAQCMFNSVASDNDWAPTAVGVENSDGKYGVRYWHADLTISSLGVRFAYAPNTALVQPVKTMNATVPAARTGMSAAWDGTNAWLFGGYDLTYSDKIVKYTPSLDTAASAATTCELPGPDAGAYYCATTTYSWQDTSSGTAVTLTDDSTSSAITFPFTFSWYGQSKTTGYISSNGYLCFTSSTSCTVYYPPAPPSTLGPNDLVACYWTDLNPASGGTIKYATVGSSPNQIFVVEFNAVPHYGGGGGTNTFQIQLTEGGEARCMFNSVTGDGGYVAVGTESYGGLTGVRYRFADFSASSLGVRFSTTAPSTSSAIAVQSAVLPSARRDTAAVYVSPYAYVIGGYDGSSRLTTVARFTPSTGAIATLSQQFVGARSGASAVAVGNDIYIFGGYSGSAYLNSIVKYSITSDGFTTLSATLPSGRSGTSAVYDGTNVYIFGGYDGSKYLEDILKFDPSAGTVTTATDTLPVGVSGTVAVSSGSNFYVLGGGRGFTYYDTVQRYAPGASLMDLQYAVKLTGVTTQTSAALTSGTVTAGDSGGVSCTAASGVWYCAVPEAHASKTVTFAGTGYVTKTADFATDRTAGTDAQQTLAISSVQYTVAVTLDTETDLTSVTWEKKVGAGSYASVSPTATNANVAYFAQTPSEADIVYRATKYGVSGTSGAAFTASASSQTARTFSLVASLSNPNVSPGSSTAGASTSYTINFGLAHAWPANGKFVVTFPAGFSIVATPTATLSSGANGAATASGNTGTRTVTLTRSNNGAVTAAGTSVSLVVSDVTNPTAAGATGTFAVELQDGSGVRLDTGTASAVTIVAGTASTVTPSPAGPLTLTVGGTQQFSATAVDAYNNAISNPTITWSKSCTSGGSVSSSGLFTAPTTPQSCTATATVNSASASVSITVNAGALASISSSPSSATIAAAGTQAFTASSADSYGNSVTLTSTWTTPSCGSLSGSGNSRTFTAPNTAGSCTFKVTSGAVESPTVTVTVTAGPLATVTVTPSSATMSGGGSLTFSAAGADSYSNTVSVTPTWSASGGSITSGGVYTAPSTAGTYTITAAQSGVSGTATVTVTDYPLAQIILDPTSASVGVGGSVSITTSGRDSQGNTVSVSPSWSSTCGGVFIVLSSTTWTAPTTSGSCTLTASQGGVSASMTATVNPGALATVTVSPSNPSVAVGGSQSFTAAGRDQYGNSVTLGAVTWGASCGSVTSAGAFTAPSTVGSCTVTATSGGVSGTSTVSVTAGAATQLAVSGDATVNNAALGTPQTLRVIVRDANNNAVNGVTVNWAVASGGGSLSGATSSSDASGIAEIVLTPGGTAGANTVTASVAGLTGSPVTFAVNTVAGSLSSLSLNPSSAGVAAGASQTFTATGRDAYSNAVTVTPTWSASCGSITAGGVFTAPSTAGSCTVTATSGLISAQAVVTVAAGALSGLATAADDLTAGAQTTYRFTFTVANPLPSDGKIVVSFPSTYSVSAPQVTLTGAAGTATATASGGVVTVARAGDGGAVSAGGSVTVALTRVTNSLLSGLTSSFTITTQTSGGTSIDTGNAPGVSLNANPLAAQSVTASAAGSWTTSSQLPVSWTPPTTQTSIQGYSIGINAIPTDVVTTTSNQYSLSGLSDGVHTIYVKTIDQNGQAVGVTTLSNVLVDTTPPAGLVVSGPGLQSSGCTSATSGFFSWSAWDATAGLDGSQPFAYAVDGAALQRTSQTGVSLQGLGDGQHTITVQAYDRAGNSAKTAYAFKVDSAAPVVQLQSPAFAPGNFPLTWNAIDLCGSVAWVELEYRYQDGPWESLSMQASASGKIDFTPYRGDGRYEFRARAADVLGNTGAFGAAGLTVTHVDRSAPAAPPEVHAVTLARGPVRVSWGSSQDSGSGLAGYIVYRVGPGGEQVRVTEGLITGTEFVDTAVSGGAPVKYVVVAVDKTGLESAKAALPHYVPLGAPPAGGGGSGAGGRLPAPHNLQVVGVRQGVLAFNKVTLVWEPVLGAKDYVVYRGRTPGFPTDDSTRLGTTAAPAFEVATPDQGRQYYVVAARDASGNEGLPAEATFFLDSIGPTSKVESPAQAPPAFRVSWVAQDQGLGVAEVMLWASDDRAEPKMILRTSQSSGSTSFFGVFGHTYRFFSVAVDSLGIVEPKDLKSDKSFATTKIVSNEVKASSQAIQLIRQLAAASGGPVGASPEPGPGAPATPSTEPFLAIDSDDDGFPETFEDPAAEVSADHIIPVMDTGEKAFVLKKAEAPFALWNPTTSEVLPVQLNKPAEVKRCKSEQGREGMCVTVLHKTGWIYIPVPDDLPDHAIEAVKRPDGSALPIGYYWRIPGYIVVMDDPETSYAVIYAPKPKTVIVFDSWPFLAALVGGLAAFVAWVEWPSVERLRRRHAGARTIAWAMRHCIECGLPLPRNHRLARFLHECYTLRHRLHAKRAWWQTAGFGNKLQASLEEMRRLGFGGRVRRHVETQETGPPQHVARHAPGAGHAPPKLHGHAKEPLAERLKRHRRP